MRGISPCRDLESLPLECRSRSFQPREPGRQPISILTFHAQDPDARWLQPCCSNFSPFLIDLRWDGYRYERENEAVWRVVRGVCNLIIWPELAVSCTPHTPGHETDVLPVNKSSR